MDEREASGTFYSESVRSDKKARKAKQGKGAQATETQAPLPVQLSSTGDVLPVRRDEMPQGEEATEAQGDKWHYYGFTCGCMKCQCVECDANVFKVTSYLCQLRIEGNFRGVICPSCWPSHSATCGLMKILAT